MLTTKYQTAPLGPKAARTLELPPSLVIKEFQTNPPVNVVGIANAFGINVWELKNLPANVSGKIWKDQLNGGLSGYSIGVNATEVYVRKRFTVAHELAHYILHRDRITDGLTEDTMYRGGLSSREETEANRLAADILMPYHLIQKLMQEGFKDVDTIARKLQVSGSAIRIRLGIPVT